MAVDTLHVASLASVDSVHVSLLLSSQGLTCTHKRSMQGRPGNETSMNGNVCIIATLGSYM